MKRKLVTIAIVAGLCFGVVVTRAVWEGRSALQTASELAEAGEMQEAVTWYRRAARWYVPLAPHVGAAYDRLEAIGQQAEEQADVALALAAWRGVRSSIMATRSFYTPHARRLEPANHRIAALMGQQELALRGADVAPPGGHASFEAFHYELLAQDRAPSVAWSIVALLGFGTWLGGGVLFALRGVSDEDRLVPRAAAASGVFVAVGMVIWMLGLYNA